MVEELSLLVNVSQDELLKEFKMVHQQVGSVKYRTKEDFELEELFKNEWKINGYKPNYTIHSFEECRQIISEING